MNGASVVKCRVPDTHYCPRVKEMEYQAQSEGHEQEETDTEARRERGRFRFCEANVALYIDSCCSTKSVNPLQSKGLYSQYKDLS